MANWRPGELDQRVTIRRESRDGDGFGGAEVPLSDVATVWAKVTPLRGRERDFADRIEPTGDYLFVFRNRANLTLLEKHRLVWRGVEYNIKFIGYSGHRSMYYEVAAERGVAQ